jgi:hypothetical protein
MFLFVLCLAIGFVSAGWFMAWRVLPQTDQRQFMRSFVAWTIKGALVPLTLWIFMNLGISWRLQPFMPEVQAAQNSGGSWFPAFVHVVTLGLFVVSSYWAAVTLGWTVWRAGAGLQEDARRSFKGLCWVCFLGMLVPAAIVVLVGGISAVGLAAIAILGPVAGYAPTILHPMKLPPIYARAMARIKFGKYSEAEWELIKELEKCEDDFQGWMMMAELYATHLNDFPAAQDAILDICNQPRTTPSQLSVALHKLADWQLKKQEDPAGARRALQIICDRLPGSHLARMAQLRIDHLPTTVEELREQQNAKPIPMPGHGAHDSEELAAGSSLGTSRASHIANECVAALNENPNNTAAREKLARLLAEHLKQADAGIEQLMLLVNLPGQDRNKMAEWLGLVAGWEIKYRQDSEVARRIVERLAREFPQTPEGISARQRLLSGENQ